HIPLLRGRDFTEADNANAPTTVVISESMAKQFWPDEDPIGKRLKMTFFPDSVREVVGVVGDVKDRRLDSHDPNPTLYWPIAQFYMPARFGRFRSGPLELAVRTKIDPSTAAAPVQHAIHELTPGTPLVRVRPLDELVAESISQQRFNMYLLAA